MKGFSRSLIFFVLLNVGYFLVYERFSYMGFGFETSIIKTLLTTAIFLIFTILLLNLKKDNWQNYLTYSWYVLVFTPSLIFITYNKLNFDLLLTAIISLLIFLLGGYQKQKYLHIHNYVYVKTIVYDLLIIIIGATLYIQAPSINFNTLLLDSVTVIESRLDFRYGSNKLISSYIFEPIGRVIIPYFFVQSLVKKQYFKIIFYLIATVIYFLTTGSLKSMLLPGALSLLFFTTNKFRKFKKNIILLFSFVLTLAIIESHFVGTIFSYNFSIRRLLYTPVLLTTTYFEHFNQFPPIFLGINSIETYGMPIARYVGEFINNKPDSRASVGIMVEAWLHARLIGVAAISFVIQRLFYYLDAIKI